MKNYFHKNLLSLSTVKVALYRIYILALVRVSSLFGYSILNAQT